MHDTGCSGLVHWDDPEGWDGEGDGRGVQCLKHLFNHLPGSLSHIGKNKISHVDISEAQGKNRFSTKYYFIAAKIYSRLTLL